MELRKDVRKRVVKWVEALESGEYVQTNSKLMRKEDETGGYSYCCLGVAERVCFRTPISELTKAFKEEVLFNEPAKLGLLSKNGMIDGCPSESLAGLNDSGKTFKYIAKVIRRYILGEKVRVR